MPQHFAGDGRFRRSALSRPCEPLSAHDAERMYAELVWPTTEAILNASAFRENCVVPTPIELLPTFWPLVDRHADHPGLTSSRKGLGDETKRADCTHWKPCSGAQMLLNRLLLDVLLAPPLGL